MFDMGFAELLIVAVVALIVLGPDKLPTALKTVGMWVGRIRRTVSSIQTEISEELRIDEMKRTAAISKEELDQELNEMTKPFNEVVSNESPMSAKASSPEELQDAAAEKQAGPSSDDSSNEGSHNPESKS